MILTLTCQTRKANHFKALRAITAEMQLRESPESSEEH
ncbi:hypothetical protein BVRB_3g064490 [Beta vulgaris subsp. vulgaris]|nr:hypothetical protein BVRB_3g064490 [Beta vulgaris subsp. vulgaris]